MQARERVLTHIGWRHRKAVIILEQIHAPGSKLLRVNALIPQTGCVHGTCLKPRITVKAQLQPCTIVIPACCEMPYQQLRFSWCRDAALVGFCIGSICFS